MKDVQAEMHEARYSRQSFFEQIGEVGQRKIRDSSVVIIGCGALGTVIANNLARSGVGRIRIVDRDIVELDNLQRQVLFDEEHARQRLPKAVAAAKRLKEINSTIELEPIVCDVSRRNVEELTSGFSVVLDGTDNFDTRFLLNDACVKNEMPWIYGAAVGSTGMTMPIIPGETPCLRCVIDEMPPPGILPTCDRVGVLNSVTGIVASLQTTAVMKLLIGEKDPPGQLFFIDVWDGKFNTLNVRRKEDCVTCAQRKFEFLQGESSSWTTVLCGRNAVQIVPAMASSIPLEDLAKSLTKAGEVSYNGFLVTLKLEDHELIIFPTGRMMVNGTTDESVARTLYSKYVGA